MFHGWPWELDRLPVGEYRDLTRFFWAVRDAERKASNPDLDDMPEPEGL